MKTSLITFQIFILLIHTSNSFCQKQQKCISHKINDVKYSLEIADSIYKTNDTITIDYTIVNEGKKDVLILWPCDTNVCGIAKLNKKHSLIYFGGDYEYQIGYISYKASILGPKKRFSTKYKMIIDQISFDNTKLMECDIIDDYFEKINNTSTIYISFHASCFFEIDKIHITFIKDKYGKYITFDNEKDGYFFNEHLNRFAIGTLKIFLKK